VYTIYTIRYTRYVCAPSSVSARGAYITYATDGLLCARVVRALIFAGFGWNDTTTRCLCTFIVRVRDRRLRLFTFAYYTVRRFNINANTRFRVGFTEIISHTFSATMHATGGRQLPSKIKTTTSVGHTHAALLHARISANLS